jgi:ketosteroid isomerase-like protein
MTNKNELTQEQIRETAEGVFKDHLKHLSGGDIEAWTALWQPDGVLEFPYATPGFPTKTEGKDAIHDYMMNFPKHFNVEFYDLKFYPTADPELVIAEFKSRGTHLETGNPYNQTYISVVQTKDGLIQLYRDFWNPLVAMESIGGKLADFIEN